MNDHAYLYANMSDKSIMYDLAAHCALVEVPPVPGGGLKRILSSSPSPPRSHFNQHLRSSGCKISCCLIPAHCWDQPLWRGWGWERLMLSWGDCEGGEPLLWGSQNTLGRRARSRGLDMEKLLGGSICLSAGWGSHSLVPPDFKHEA